jgi:nitric oxide dioxygenase
VTWFAEQSDSTQVADGKLVGFMDVTAVELPLDAEYYLCGPLVFMQSVRSALIERGVPARDIQYEVFGPDLWLADFQ